MAEKDFKYYLVEMETYKNRRHTGQIEGIYADGLKAERRRLELMSDPKRDRKVTYDIVPHKMGLLESDTLRGMGFS